MTAKEWLDKHNIDLSKIHGNIGDYDGNIFIETKDGWIFWNAQGITEKLPNAGRADGHKLRQPTRPGAELDKRS